MDDNLNVCINKESFITSNKGDVTMFYEVIKKIGEGSFGKIYKVKNKQSGDIRAMKQIIKTKIPNLEKFKTEIKILSILDHPNIVRLFEVFEDDKYFYLLIELCTGGELLEKIKQKKITKERDAAIIFNQLMSGVYYFHQRGIVHRDLKPENILFATEEKDSPIKIIDFGLSVLLQNTEEESQLPDNNETEEEKKLRNMGFKRLTSKVGTILYISPEILKGSYNEKCDIWACGVILYILLCGYPPFYGQTDQEIYRNISEEKFEFPQAEWKKISKEAKDLITHMLAPAKKRYNAKQVLNHKWLEMRLKKLSDSNIVVLDYSKFVKYKKFNKLKKTVLTFIASRLNTEETKNIEEIFSKIDTEKNGFITYDAFKKFLCKELNEEMLEEDDSQIRKDFKGVDMDHNDHIDYTEFLAVNLDKNIYLKEEKLQEAFRMFDVQDEGSFNKDDVIRVLNLYDLNDKEEIANKLIEENDFDKDGKINYDDFKKMMIGEEKAKEELQNGN